MNELKKYLPSGSFIVMILCFLLPFFVVKCNGEDVISMKGINFIGIGQPSINTDFGDFGGKFDSKNEKIKNDNFNIFAFILLLVLSIGAFFGISKALKNDIFKGKIDEKTFDKIFFSLNIASFVLMIIFILDMKFDNSEENKIPKEYEKYISINIGSGIMFLFLISILNIIFYGNELKLFDKHIEKIKNKVNEKNNEKIVDAEVEKIEEKN